MTALGYVPGRALVSAGLEAPAERYLIVNADDFGRTFAITSGVIRAYERGVLSSASLMVRWPAAEKAAVYARDWPQLGVGLHVDLEEWTVVDGEWLRTYSVVDVADRVAVADEIQRQVDEFRRLVGREPTHLDSHQHVHLQHPASAAFGEAARRLGVPLRRLTPGIRYRGDFYGQTSRGDPYPQGITVDALLDVLSGLGPGVSELACHPGEFEDSDSPYRLERISELDALCDPRVREALVAEGIELRSFSDVAPELEFDTDTWRASAERVGIASYNTNDYADAATWFAVATSTDPENVGAWLWLSRARAKQEDVDGARQALERAISLEPEWISVKLQNTDVLTQEGRNAEAISILEEVVERHADRADLLRRATQRLAFLKADASAIRAADALLALSPGDDEARFAKAGALWRTGETEQAKLLISPEGGRPSGRLAARFLLDAGAPADAWEAVRSDSSIQLPLLIAIATALRRSGAITSAIAALERALAVAPGDASVRRQLEVAQDEAAVLQGHWRRPPSSRGSYRARRGRVLHFVGHSAPHSQVGYTVRTHSLARAQLAVGLEPHVVTRLGFPWDSGVKDAELSDCLDGVSYHRLRGAGPTSPLLGERLSETVLRATELVRQLRPAVLHAASDYRNALVALAVGRAFGLPVVYEVRGFWEETRLAGQGPGATERECYVWHSERELECMQQATRVVTLAETMRTRLIDRGITADAITVIPNAVDTEKFVPVERDTLLAERLGLAPDEAVLGYISSFSSYEGIRYLIDATARLAAMGRRVRCLLVGDGELRSELEAHADAAGVRELVVFTGRVAHAEVLAYYGLIDVFVVPRTDDRVSQLVTPLKPYEAMAAGRAVVVSQLPALTEMIVEGETALTFRPEDAEDLATVIDGLIEDPTRRAALGKAGREWVCAERTWLGNGDRYLQLYRDLGAA